MLCAGKDQVNKAMKGEKASGLYFPITAVQVCGSDESATGFNLLYLVLGTSEQTCTEADQRDPIRKPPVSCAALGLKYLGDRERHILWFDRCPDLQGPL